MARSISEITQLWDRILVQLAGRINDRNIFDSFFSGTYIYRIEGNSMVVVVNSGLAASILATKYNDLISEVVLDTTQSNFVLSYIQKTEINQVEVKPVEEKQTFFANSSINTNFTFDNFVSGPSNREALQAALMTAANPGKMFNPLFIYSDSGLGKTHLLHAMGNYIKKNSPAAKVLYISTDDFVDEFIHYVHGDKDSESLKDFFKKVDFLLVDDIQFLADKTKTEEMFFHIFNNLVSAGKQIVLTSDRHPTDLKGLESRLVSRFSSGLTVNITKPDLETSKAILRKKITANNLDINRFDDEVITFFADKFSNNVRELEGALNRLLFYIINIRETNHVTMEIAAESVQPLIDNEEMKTKLSKEKVINVVADYYNLTPSQLAGRIRTQQIALARHISMYLIRELLDVPFAKIGQSFGGKDHSTVINAINKVEKQLKTDAALQTAVKELRKRLKS
ncbi:MAG: chromosomal replication initiator protein DnaA [Bacilli bacterium]|jgi:chromosomal replication initiator protein|nr:chromosomal replication initiator protein DnaA [Bacilli bacterium]MDD3389088.1 chromosomal replication initiator protein DnaA [Bacilli bacterium]MDD4520828.1 chromosomal replication initiator protein DnaA [Bacilli bacterium]MDY0399660.1 chromosomal replication initiator protein DnaA [Bacilli bacterium]